MNIRSFGKLSDGTAVSAATVSAYGAEITVLDYGGTLQSLVVPSPSGAPVNVVLGYDDAQGYERGNAFFGATIGRVGNRIGGGAFTLNGREYTLAKNDGENHLHGGVMGFHRQLWHMEARENRVVLTRRSPDGEEGYPGNLDVCVTYLLEPGPCLRIVYEARTDRDTLVNLTNHSYFNLNGGGSVLGHILQIPADRFCEGDESVLPTGRLLPVDGTPFDFREPKAIGAEIGSGHPQLRFTYGYDHNYCLSGRRAAVLTGDQSGVTMTVETDQPGMQVYSANFLTPKHTAVCLETQCWPDAIHHPDFPSPILRADEQYRSETVFRFGER